MRREVLMPRLAEEAEEGVVVTWFVEPGAPVSEGDLLAELQVAKVSSEMHSPFSGRVVQLLVEPGGVASQGVPIAVIEEGEAAAPSVRPVPEAVTAAAEKPPAAGPA
ncbi:MAG: biotin/lipoyl-containing protein, partial [Candidatus Dormiibacterota bacterium]